MLTGGTRLPHPSYFLAPTILDSVGPGNPAFRHELFAPVAMIFRVKSEQDAIALANDSLYGLGGPVITTDVARGKRVAAQLATGMVFINDTVISVPDLPFGGVKNSGLGASCPTSASTGSSTGSLSRSRRHSLPCNHNHRKDHHGQDIARRRHRRQR